MAERTFLFTSESVTEGHPDKIADQISDAVLDAALTNDPMSRVACETLITTGLVVVAGEMTTDTYIDIPRLVRETVKGIGYTRAKYGFDAETCGVVVAIDEQSPDIAQGVDKAYELTHDPGDDDPLDSVGAGDQGMMFGYASNETRELMPLPIMLAHRITKRLSEVRKADVLPYLRPDGKAQVSIRYDVDADGKQTPGRRSSACSISTQHREGLDPEAMIKPDLIEHVLRPILPKDLYDEKQLDDPRLRLRQPDRQVRDRRPDGRHGPDRTQDHRRHLRRRRAARRRRVLGQGSDEGRPLSRVRRALRGEEHRRRRARRPRQIQVAYAIGVAHPFSVLVETFGTEKLPVERIEALVKRALRPASGRDPARPRPAPADLPQDRRVRPLRPRRPRLHVGAHRQGRRAARGRRPRGRHRLALARARTSPSAAFSPIDFSTPPTRHAQLAGGRLRGAQLDDRAGREALVVEPVQEVAVVLGEAHDRRARPGLERRQRLELAVLGLLDVGIDRPAVRAAVGMAELARRSARPCRR